MTVELFEISTALDTLVDELKQAQETLAGAEFADTARERADAIDEAALALVSQFGSMLRLVEQLRETGADIDDPPGTEEALLLLVGNMPKLAERVERVAREGVADMQAVAERIGAKT